MPKKTEPTFWLKDGGYILLTGEVWRDCILVAFSGATPETIREQGLTESQLEGAKQVEACAVPLEWWRAFSALNDEIESNPPAKPKPESPPEPQPTQAEVEEEMLTHIAAGTDPLTAGLAAADRFRTRVYRPIKGPCPLSFFTGAFVAFIIIAVVLLQCQ
jgi:hypothetical protein